MSLILLASQLSFFTSCNTVKEKQKFSEYYFDYFDTVTTITGYTETEEEFNKICKMGPDYIQGYFFGKPCAYENFVEDYVKK